MIETDKDMEKTLVTASMDDMERYNHVLDAPVPVRR
jgi:hypothetical protein